MISGARQRRIELDFLAIQAAAIAGERCPKSHPEGPLSSGSIGVLYEAGRIKSEVYARNWRVVTILTGEHAGKSTAPPPRPGAPYLVNGRHVDCAARIR